MGKVIQVCDKGTIQQWQELERIEKRITEVLDMKIQKMKDLQTMLRRVKLWERFLQLVEEEKEPHEDK